ncbi:hypothetical protein CVT25_005312 [Psilocybe cyanescens]|uniref:AAA+ ATPase domain-containing protein n=1 Tax=Psilocybe cyanescens TaxID=93625 RepID=A0A409VPR7_PSICY|nr:hypothetical protein CVT25_005312 [Psilocybe cyanescens]
MSYESADTPDVSWFGPANALTRIFGFSFIASFFQGINGKMGSMGEGAGGSSSYIANSMRLFLLGTIIESGRRFFGWAMERFKPFQYSITAHFAEGDPAYEWIILFLTEEQVWTRSRQFRVNASSSLRQWSVSLTSILKPGGHVDEHAEYVPTYDEPQLFRWRGYWAEIRRGGSNKKQREFDNIGMDNSQGKLSLTLYTRNMGVLSALVDDARQRYVATSRPHVIVHSADHTMVHPRQSIWRNAKRKMRRPLSSIILQEGVINSLVEDAREFIKSEAWYIKAGIPHRRGYLLHGPPGTGKTSTIYAVVSRRVGNGDIFSLTFVKPVRFLPRTLFLPDLITIFSVDDSYLERAVSSIPKQAIILIEDIDCAFPSREDEEEEASMNAMVMSMNMSGMGRRGALPMRTRSAVTLSGLLNILDGVGSEEGKLFFATTNYIDRLDPALMRPGRIDVKIPYQLATQEQAAALFARFYPKSLAEESVEKSVASESHFGSEKQVDIHILAERFSSSVPQHEFSTAELQGFLLSCKHEPLRAAEGVGAWVEQERKDKLEREKREEEAKEKKKKKKEEKEARHLEDGSARPGVSVGGRQHRQATPTPTASRSDTVGMPQQLAVNDDSAKNSAHASSTSSHRNPTNVAFELQASPNSELINRDDPSKHYNPGNDGHWISIMSSITRFLGLSFLAPLFQSDSLAFNSVKLFLLGSLVETGRRFFRWVYERFDFFQYSITAQFDEGDPVYDWITLFLTEKKIWKRSRRFHVTARSSRRRWGININNNREQAQINGPAEYVPTYEMAQLFRWNGYWAETRRSIGSRGQHVYTEAGGQPSGSRMLFLTIYTRDMTALSSFVDDAREMYLNFSQPHVTVHTVEQVCLCTLDDAKEFLSMVEWYSTAGIPHRRGYLLHGPPGTGKTSTIYAIAGELGLEIYSLSLASGFVDDSFLQRAVSSIPNTAILLIEDIDCAFQSREDMEDNNMPSFPGMVPGLPPNFSKSGVTLSGLLNVLDGVGSEEGKLFFATTNYVERLDPALLRPGRIDRKIQYKLSTKAQAEALFLRFYPPAYTTLSGSSQLTTTTASISNKEEKSLTDTLTLDKEATIKSLASQFASQFPENEFSLAELQGYLLSCKKEPERAVTEFKVWIDEERKEKEEIKTRAEERTGKLKDKKDAKEAEKLQGSLEKLGLWGNGSLSSYGATNSIRINEGGLSGNFQQPAMILQSAQSTTGCSGCNCSGSHTSTQGDRLQVSVGPDITVSTSATSSADSTEAV